MGVSMSRWGNDLYAGRRSYDVVGARRRWFLVATSVVLISAVLLGVRGLNPGIEFRGGSEFTVPGVEETTQQPAVDAVTGIPGAEIPRVSVVGADTLRVQTSQLDDVQTQELAAALAAAYGVPENEVNSSYIGPVWGQDVTTKALRALVIFLALISLVLTVYFRDWRMAVAALVALLHDLVITVGLYAAIGWEVTPATVIGFLTILGYSLYDTVVVFDKVNENVRGVLEQRRYTYGELANLAVNQTLVRSVNTSVVAVLPVGSILFIGAFLLGAGTLRDIALALFVGILVGTFSSVFLATPLLVWLREREARVAAHTRARLEERRAAATASGARDTVTVGALVPGQHLGTRSQPRRRKGHKPGRRQ
ncbi:protein translocase subunit SecF [Cellulomonas bogoriensis]|uniref:Protein-export membrane protein SecF n=1 Tax=Cellulomonas bogoriensis 69B4 = DSM 16987 TaxID=1386082 RepID=A0A0A0BVS7_9CELL|nr:protein translocase subunit SecF [Cellulomonas bogoriensis]KGM11757.1 preprotein translocase subunit SecF [Cellulomonas bogoriensis 69B4 = DSM 16987]